MSQIVQSIARRGSTLIGWNVSSGSRDDSCMSENSSLILDPGLSDSASSDTTIRSPDESRKSRLQTLDDRPLFPDPLRLVVQNCHEHERAGTQHSVLADPNDSLYSLASVASQTSDTSELSKATRSLRQLLHREGVSETEYRSLENDRHRLSGGRSALEPCLGPITSSCQTPYRGLTQVPDGNEDLESAEMQAAGLHRNKRLARRIMNHISRSTQQETTRDFDMGRTAVVPEKTKLELLCMTEPQYLLCFALVWTISVARICTSSGMEKLVCAMLFWASSIGAFNGMTQVSRILRSDARVTPSILFSSLQYSAWTWTLLGLLKWSTLDIQTMMPAGLLQALSLTTILLNMMCCALSIVANGSHSHQNDSMVCATSVVASVLVFSIHMIMYLNYFRYL